MYKHNFWIDLDLNGNFVRNFGVDKYSELPTTDLFDGRMVNCNGVLYIYNNSKWTSLQGPTGVSPIIESLTATRATQMIWDINSINQTKDTITYTTVDVSGGGSITLQINIPTTTQKHEHYFMIKSVDNNTVSVYIGFSGTYNRCYANLEDGNMFAVEGNSCVELCVYTNGSKDVILERSSVLKHIT
jgi:hypothetical protein